MASPLTPKQWIIVILVNVVVSAVTTLMIVRVLTNQPAARAMVATTPIVADQAPATNLPPTAASVLTTSQSSAVAIAPASTSTPKPTTPPIPSATPARISATATVPATQSTGSPSVRISAVLYPGQRQREVVVIVNEGNEVNLKGWTLGASRNISYTFGSVTLFKDSFINLHTTSGADVPTDLFWNRTDPAWQPGDVLTLANQGAMIATFTLK